MSILYGIETAKSAIMASQSAMNITSQNVANANTDGYTRQRVDLVALNYRGGPSQFAPPVTAAIGQGVGIGGIVQIRDGFLDERVRTANSRYNTWSTGLSALNDIENVFDETENNGIHSLLNSFYNELQSLSNNTDGAEYLSIVRSSAEKVTQAFNQYASQLKRIRDHETSMLEIDVGSANKAIDKINAVNEMIKEQKIRGVVSGELMDERNRYIDELSSYMDIKVTENTDGTVNIRSQAGDDLLTSVFSVDKSGDTVKLLRSEGGDPPVAYIPAEGKLRGCLNVLNGAGPDADVGAGESLFRGLMFYEKSLDAFAAAFIGTFNSINSLTAAPDPSDPPVAGPLKPLFSGTGAADIKISTEWHDDASYLVTGVGLVNDNVVRMINAMDQDIDNTAYPGLKGSFESYSRMLMSEIAVDVSYHKDMTAMAATILDESSYQREAVTGVSIDEETINMTTYQRAFQAASRLMTVYDEMLNTLINNMGIVGR